MTFGCQMPSFSVDLETVIDNLPSAVIVVDRDRRVLLANRQAGGVAMEQGLQSLEKWDAAPPRSVLVVDDESAVCHVMRLALGRAGCDVITAESPEAAIAAVREHTCPVAFVDLNLPGMNGLQLCRAIQAERPGTVTYLLTGYAPKGAAAESRAAGAADLLIKPVELKVLIALAREALAAERGGDDRRRAQRSSTSVPSQRPLA